MVHDGRNADAIVTCWSSVGEPDPSLRQFAAMFEHRAYGLIDDLECPAAMSTEPDR